MFFVQFVFEQVVVDSVEVHWLCRGYAEPTNITTQLLEPPPKVVMGESLKRLIIHLQHTFVISL